jgi:uncharacterized membrane protein
LRIVPRTLLAFFAVLAALVGIHSPVQAQARAQTKKPPVTPTGPAAPQSKHYPILLLATGTNPPWSLRIGLKGPERLDRPAYPPIALEPAEVTQEGAAESWTYHAKDIATGATFAIHLTREACSDTAPPADAAAPPTTPPPTTPPPTRYSFRATAEHAQVGAFTGCARVAAELFPRINNQPDQDADDPDKKKPTPPETTVTNFKAPVDVAYISPTRKIVLKHLNVPHIIAPEGSQLALSHDGKRLLYTREDKTIGRAITLYDAATGKSTDLLTGQVQQGFWSPDDTRIAFMKFVDGHWRLWIAPVGSPETASSTYSGDIASVQGWTDLHTIVVDDLQQLAWVGDDGVVHQTLSEKELFGDAFGFSSANTFRVNPINPDLLLIAAEWIKPPQGVPTDPHMGGGFGFFLYEIHSKRRTTLSPLNMFAQNAEWSRDGLQVLFTGADSTRRYATWRMFWDGSVPKRYVDGTALVIGQ